jgi:hypothetical protein
MCVIWFRKLFASWLSSVFKIRGKAALFKAAFLFMPVYVGGQAGGNMMAHGHAACIYVIRIFICNICDLA